MIEYNEFEEHYFLDINWYFADYYNRLCVVASGGGVLPIFLLDKESRNNNFHEIVMDLEEQFESRRNEDAIQNIIDYDPNLNIEQYFRDFESLAKKGFYVYDKVDINDHNDLRYVLVVYPIYDTRTDPYPINPKDLQLIPKLNYGLISRTNSSFGKSNFTIRNLITLVNSKYRWRK